MKSWVICWREIFSQQSCSTLYHLSLPWAIPAGTNVCLSTAPCPLLLQTPGKLDVHSQLYVCLAPVGTIQPFPSLEISYSIEIRVFKWLHCKWTPDASTAIGIEDSGANTKWAAGTSLTSEVQASSSLSDVPGMWALHPLRIFVNLGSQLIYQRSLKGGKQIDWPCFPKHIFLWSQHFHKTVLWPFGQIASRAVLFFK